MQWSSWWSDMIKTSLKTMDLEQLILLLPLSIRSFTFFWCHWVTATWKWADFHFHKIWTRWWNNRNIWHTLYIIWCRCNNANSCIYKRLKFSISFHSFTNIFIIIVTDICKGNKYVCHKLTKKKALMLLQKERKKKKKIITTHHS